MGWVISHSALSILIKLQNSHTASSVARYHLGALTTHHFAERDVDAAATAAAAAGLVRLVRSTGGGGRRIESNESSNARNSINRKCLHVRVNACQKRGHAQTARPHSSCFLGPAIDHTFSQITLALLLTDTKYEIPVDMRRGRERCDAKKRREELAT